jgi:hypothetical protein
LGKYGQEKDRAGDSAGGKPQLSRRPGPKCCAGPWSFGRGERSPVPGVLGVLYGALG